MAPCRGVFDWGAFDWGKRAETETRFGERKMEAEAFEKTLRSIERDMAYATACRHDAIRSIRAAKHQIRTYGWMPVVDRQERAVILRLWINLRWFDAKMDDASRRYEQALKAAPTEFEQPAEQVTAQGELF